MKILIRHKGIPRFTHQLRTGRCGASRILRKSELSINLLNCICTCKGVQKKSKFQYTGILSAAACVIAQQYSSTTFVSLRFLTRKEKLGARLKNVIVKFFTFLKLRKSEFSYIEIADVGVCLYTNFCHGSTTLVGIGLLIVEVLKSHSDTPHSVSLLWTSDRPVTALYPTTPTTFAKDRHLCPPRDSNPQSLQASGRSHHALDRAATGIGL